MESLNEIWNSFAVLSQLKIFIHFLAQSIQWHEIFTIIFSINSIDSFSMNNKSASLQYTHDFTVPRLAPVISLKPISKEVIKPKRKISKPKTEAELPQFYDKPIYKSKKYDLL